MLLGHVRTKMTFHEKRKPAMSLDRVINYPEKNLAPDLRTNSSMITSKRYRLQQLSNLASITTESYL